ncbi:ABC transporter ATP-binding protein [Acrocarpospora pleiomorpha]|uniref:ABC transporter ATP-binding protein n=1 Tax=Acrocarpospora pleiomorpha TaxID=90975 RepID=A0A5M3XL60_9ACTN|nr:ATP-binding cassette domain-containing protein [Acrocarpospora pleiomorpha]GES20391.1 ABC transporter ATP-binding protein [Acrocarpospora pleiomorpha]
MAEQPVIEAVGVSRRYATTAALREAHLIVREGEIVGIYGASGSGKSTLLRLLAAIEPPDTGEVLLGGAPAWVRRYGMRHRRPPRPGYVMPIFQNPFSSLDVRWPIWRSVTEPVAIIRRASGAERRALAGERLAAVGLSGLDLEATPSELSIGQCQRVAIARALAAAPAAVVADEPTSALDVTTVAGILRLFKQVAAGGTALVLVSHDENMLRVLCDRVRPMKAGVLEPGGC